MSQGHTLGELARIVGGEVRGDEGIRIRSVASIEQAEAGQITWLADPSYADKLSSSRASAVVVSKDFGETPMPALRVDDAAGAMVILLEKLAPPPWRPVPGVNPSAVVAESASLGSGVAVGPNAVIGEGVRIGEGTSVHAGVVVGPDVTIGSDCVLWPNVVIRERCTIGSRVILHPNVTIGSDGYGYRFIDGRHMKIPQTGTVRIEDDVEVGAGSCIDRAKVGATVIGAGTKIDNLVQIAHNVEIGSHCLLVAQVGIAGTVRMGQYVVLGGKVGVRDHVTIGDGVQVGACSCIAQDVPAGERLAGIPARDGRLWLRQQRLLDKFPEIHAQMRRLEKRVASLEATDDRQAG